MDEDGSNGDWRSGIKRHRGPSAEGDVLVDEDSQPSDSTSDLHNPLSLDEIRAPKTCGNDGKPLLFDSLDLCFDHFQEETKRCGFALLDKSFKVLIRSKRVNKSQHMTVTCWEVHGIGEVVHGIAFAPS
jgi:hypothetical protein